MSFEEEVVSLRKIFNSFNISLYQPVPVSWDQYRRVTELLVTHRPICDRLWEKGHWSRLQLLRFKYEQRIAHALICLVICLVCTFMPECE